MLLAWAGGVGAQTAARMIDGQPRQLMLVAAAILVSCALLTHITHDAAIAHRTRVPHDPQQAWDHRGGFSLVLSERYLLLIALSVLILNFVNTTGDFLLAQLVNGRAHLLPRAQQLRYIAGFYGDLQTLISVLTALAQILVVGRLFKAIGVGGSLLLLPVFSLAGYGTSMVAPLLGLVTAVKVVQGSTEYSLQNTVQQALFLPTSRDAKYKAKAAIDTLFVRLGDLSSTAVVFAGTLWGFSAARYALVNVVVSLGWIFVALRLRKLSQLRLGSNQHARRAPALAHESAPSPAGAPR
jgi:AAA family ATP:ADP antiporter